MAILVQLDYEGVRPEHYEEIIEMLGLLPGGPPPHGVLFHCVTPVEGGIRIIDLWESREELERFQAEHIAPILADLGVRYRLTTQFFEPFNYFVARRRLDRQS